MSFILDALKKSESDRQEKSTPDISDVPTARPQPRGARGVWYLVAFLALAVLGLLAVVLRPAKPPAPMVTQDLTLPERPLESPRPEALRPAEEAPRETSAATAQSVAPRPEREPEPQLDNPPPAPEPAPAAAATPTAVDTEALLTFNDLRASGNVDLPDLHIDLHVYSENPRERFVFINMNQYRENAVLTEGPRVQQIISEGVLLEYIGTTFLLPRE